MNEFGEGTYPPQVSDRLRGGTEKSPGLFSVSGVSQLNIKTLNIKYNIERWINEEDSGSCW
jgi:hypothetical protein